MSDIKLFRVQNGQTEQLEGSSVAVEKSLQTLIERHLETMLGVRMLATEYGTGKTHGGRIDTLGIDENGSPVIIEYKRATNQNVINQGLYYLDWLMDHKAEFKLLVLERFGNDNANAIDWSSPRLLCIAGDFTKFDGHAVAQINRHIELIRYRRYGSDLVLFEQLNTPVSEGVDVGVPRPSASDHPVSTMPRLPDAGVGNSVTSQAAEALQRSSSEQRDRYEALEAFLLALGDDVQFKILKYYFAFQRLKNFACVQFHSQLGEIIVFVKGDLDSVPPEPGFARDVRLVGHPGTGNIELTIRSDHDLERAKPFLVKSYEIS